MITSFLYFDIFHAIETHDFLIRESGGSSGIRDIGLLKSVLEHIQNDLYYPLLEDKVCHLVYSINKNHAFSDGNKRTSITLGAYFLEVNDLTYCLDKFIIEMENIAVHVADNKIDKDLLHEIISSIIYEYDFDESLRLKIIDAISENTV